MLKNKYFKKIVFATLVFLYIGAVVLMPPLVSLAAAPTEGLSLQTSPLPIDLETKPGSSLESDLRVRNAGSQDETLEVKLLNVTEDDNGIVHLSQAGPSDSYFSWVSFDRTSFDAPPGEWQTIKMTVDVPSSAAFGYYFAVEYLRANTEPAQPGKEVARGAVATFILLNADAPGAKRSASIVSFTADKKTYEFLPASFTVKLRATGNVHVAPHGNVFITKGGKQIDTLDINAAEGNILPGSDRFFSTTWSDGFPVYVAKYNANVPVVDKNNKPVYTLKWDFSKANHLRFGKYTAKLVMIYDDGTRDVPLQASVSFWVIPWRVIGIVVGLVALIAGLITYVVILRRRLKHANRHSNSSKRSSS